MDGPWRGEKRKISDLVDVLPVIGIYDVFSASIAAKYFDGLFVSGFSFAASHYGLPDIGFIAWRDVVDLVQRIRTVLPDRKAGGVDIKACNTILENNLLRRDKR